MALKLSVDAQEDPAPPQPSLEETKRLTPYNTLVCQLKADFRVSCMAAAAVRIRSHWLGGSTSPMVDSENDDDDDDGS